jgi:hypothetical protein
MSKKIDFETWIQKEDLNEGDNHTDDHSNTEKEPKKERKKRSPKSDHHTDAHPISELFSLLTLNEFYKWLDSLDPTSPEYYQQRAVINQIRMHGKRATFQHMLELFALFLNEKKLM